MSRRLLKYLLAFIICLIVMPFHRVQAESSIRDQDGNTYTNIQNAFNAVSENAEMTLYISETVYARSGASGLATLNKAGAIVRIIPETKDATIIGSLSCNNASSTLILGNNSADYNLIIQGGINITGGVLETNSEVSAHYTSNPTINIGYNNCPNDITVRINGGKYSNTLYPAIFMGGEKTTVEYIKDATLTSSNSDGVINPSYKSTTKLIDNCTINGTSYGLKLTRGAYVEMVSNNTITCSGMAINLRYGEPDAPTRIENIIQNTLVSTGSGSSSSTINLDYSTTGDVSIGLIKDNYIECNSTDRFCGGIQLLSLSGRTYNVSVDQINGNTIRSNKGASGIFVQYGHLGDLIDNDVLVNVNAPTGPGKGLEVIYQSSLKSVQGGKYVSLGTSESSFGIRIEGSQIAIDKIVDVEIISGNYRGLHLTGTLGELSNSTMEAVTNAGLYTNQSIDSIDSCDISSVDYPALYNSGEIDTITNTNIISEKNYALNNYAASIKTIDSSTITSTGSGSSGMGIMNYRGSIENIQNTEITANYGIYNYGSTSTKTPIGLIDTCVISSTEGVGIYNNAGQITEIANTSITSTNGIVTTGTTGVISLVTESEINSSQSGITAQRGGQVTNVEQVTIDAGTSGIKSTGENSSIGSLTNNKVNATEDAVIVIDKASIERLVSGVYIGGTNAVQVDESNLIKIDTTKDSLLVLYGKNGYAVKDNNPSTKILLEPILETEKPMQGYGRYYGTTGILAEENDYQFPMFYASVPYKLSTLNVPVSGIDDVKFYYLTTDCKVEYNPNEAPGTTIVNYQGEWRSDLKATTNTYEYPGYVFTHWNTEANGSGIRYNPGDVLDITSDDFVLYAQWEKMTPTKYTITYKLNGGTYNGSTKDIIETYDKNTMIKIHEAPTRNGYKFLYWEGSVYYPNDTYQVTENHTFAAKWTPINQSNQTRYIVPDTSAEDDIYFYIITFILSLLIMQCLISVKQSYK